MSINHDWTIIALEFVSFFSEFDQSQEDITADSPTATGRRKVVETKRN